jgi:signal peptidase
VRFVNKLLSWLVYAAVVALLVFAMVANFLVIAQSLFAPLSVVEGNSMSPNIRNDDAVFISSVEPEQLKIGDVVVFADPESPGDSIMHRIISLDTSEKTTLVVTKGDANPTVDPFAIPAQRISGKVSAVFPRAGALLSYIHSPYGFIVCVICPVALLFLYFICRWYLERSMGKKSFLSHDIIAAK